MPADSPSRARADRFAVRLAFVLCCLLSLFAIQHVRAAILYSYDLDSLVYMSSDIVEAELVRHYTERNLELAEIKVASVHKGAFAPGQSVAVTALSFYRIPEETFPYNTKPLQTGETFIFFLSRAKKVFLYDIPDDAVIYWTAPSGLKLVRENKVIGFSQYLGNPGPYAAQLPERFARVELEEYRAQIRASITKTEAWAELLKEPAVPESVPKLLDLLRERAQSPDSWLRDQVTETACVRLADLHDPETLFEALAVTKPISRSILGRGFGTPAGREALLRKLGDEREPLEKRLIYARLLMRAGAAYHQTFTEITENGNTVIGKPHDNNAEYLTRIARLALDNRQQEDLCLALLDSLDFLLRTIKDTREEALIVDRNAALPVLKTLYDAAQSERMKFQLEVTINNGSREAYDRLNSPCGPVISVVTIPDRKNNAGPKEGTLAYEYVIHVLDQPVDAPSLVLADPQTGKARIIPSQLTLRGQGISGLQTITLPQDLPHGRYRVYLQFTRDGKVISRGHYAETEL